MSGGGGTGVIDGLSPLADDDSSPAALLAAGILAAVGGGGAVDLTTGSEAEWSTVLREVLTLGTVWERAGSTRPDDLPVFDGRGLTEWQDPGPLPAAVVEPLAAAWAHALRPPSPAFTHHLRLRVRTTTEARRVNGLDAGGGRRASAVVAIHGDAFEWRWPLVVGVVPGPNSAALMAAIDAGPFRGEQYTVEVLDTGRDRPYEIVVVDGAALPFRDDPVAEALHRAGCVIGVGGGAPAEVLETLVERYEPNIAVAIPSGWDWWAPFFRELSHDVPVDAAAVTAVPDALVAGDESILDLTAVGHWAVAAAEQSGLGELVADLPGLEFAHEDDGSRSLNRSATSAREQGGDPAVHVELGQRASAAPDDGDRPTRGDPTVPPRRLIGAFWQDDRECRGVLPPAAELALELRIAVPSEGEIAADQPFPEPEDAGPAATLDVVVRSALWPDAQRQRISLPMERRELSSTSALFGFTSPAAGQVVEFDILVSWQNRPLQAATLTAAVRERALPREGVRLLVHALSTPGEPTDSLTPADVQLCVRSDEVRNEVTEAWAPLGNAQRMLDDIELLASQTLGTDDAPDDLTDERSVALLVALARKGVDLRHALAGIGLEGARTIDLRVASTARVLPLELTYEGTAPRPGAKLCEHHRGNPPAPGETCARTSTRRVCPYAFWGMHRRIFRTLPVESAEGRTQKLRLNDVLYAAAERADSGSSRLAPDERPTGVLVDAATHLLHSSQPAVITNWTEWRRQIRDRRPALLMVLAHTEVQRGELTLQIGSRSVLAKPDVTASVIRPSGAPAPLVVLMACASGQSADAFGTLPGVFTACGAAAVVAPLTRLAGRHGAAAARELMGALADAATTGGSVADALWSARRALISQGLLLGLLLVDHGDTDTRVSI